jgi:hypothetical protein
LASEGVRDEQRKFIKYNHLVANLLIYHNVVTMTKALERLAIDGHTFDEELASSVSPYQTGHMNRFGRYAPEPRQNPGAVGQRPCSADAAAYRTHRAGCERRGVTIQHESLPGV